MTQEEIVKKYMAKMNREEKAGKVAYEAYCLYTNNKSLVTGDDLPAWEVLQVNIAAAWITSAQAVIKYVQRNDQS